MNIIELICYERISKFKICGYRSSNPGMCLISFDFAQVNGWIVKCIVLKWCHCWLTMSGSKLAGCKLVKCSKYYCKRFADVVCTLYEAFSTVCLSSYARSSGGIKPCNCLSIWFCWQWGIRRLSKFNLHACMGKLILNDLKTRKQSVAIK